MKTTILIEDVRTQLVLKPQGEHDEAVLKILEKVANSHRVGLYQREGGFSMFDPPRHGTGTDLMIVFDNPKEEPAS